MSLDSFYIAVLTGRQAEMLLEVSKHDFNGPPAPIPENDLVGGAEDIVGQQVGVGIRLRLLLNGVVVRETAFQEMKPIPASDNHTGGAMIQPGQIHEHTESPETSLRIRGILTDREGRRQGTNLLGRR